MTAKRKSAGTINKNAQKQLKALEGKAKKKAAKKKSHVVIWPKYKKDK